MGWLTDEPFSREANEARDVGNSRELQPGISPWRLLPEAHAPKSAAKSAGRRWHDYPAVLDPHVTSLKAQAPAHRATAKRALGPDPQSLEMQLPDAAPPPVSHPQTPNTRKRPRHRSAGEEAEAIHREHLHCPALAAAQLPLDPSLQRGHWRHWTAPAGLL